MALSSYQFKKPIKNEANKQKPNKRYSNTDIKNFDYKTYRSIAHI